MRSRYSQITVFMLNAISDVFTNDYTVIICIKSSKEGIAVCINPSFLLKTVINELAFDYPSQQNFLRKNCREKRFHFRMFQQTERLSRLHEKVVYFVICTLSLNNASACAVLLWNESVERSAAQVVNIIVSSESARERGKPLAIHYEAIQPSCNAGLRASYARPPV